VFYEDAWRTIRRFKNSKEVNAHLEETQAIRLRGDTQIVEGRVIDTRTNTQVAHVEPFDIEIGPTMAEAANTPKGSLVGVNVKICEEKVSECPGSE